MPNSNTLYTITITNNTTQEVDVLTNSCRSFIVHYGCSDGRAGMVGHADIALNVKAYVSLKERLRELIDKKALTDLDRMLHNGWESGENFISSVEEDNY
jgi:L-asparaginase II